MILSEKHRGASELQQTLRGGEVTFACCHMKNGIAISLKFIIIMPVTKGVHVCMCVQIKA